MKILPHESVGPLHFGDSRAEVREKLGQSFFPFKKHIGYPEIDVFDEAGLHAHYTEDGSLEFVELFGHAEVTLDNVRLLGHHIDVVLAQLAALGHASEWDNDVLRFDTAGISCTLDEQSCVASVGVYMPGYYD